MRAGQIVVACPPFLPCATMVTGDLLMAKRTNRVAWGLAAVLALLLMIGVGTLQYCGISSGEILSSVVDPVWQAAPLSSSDERFLAAGRPLFMSVWEPSAFPDLTHQVRGVDLAPAVLRTLDQLERHGQSRPA